MEGNELWSATLDPHSPRYEQWKGILGSEKVPLKSPAAYKTKLGDEEDEVYPLDIGKLPGEAFVRLCDFIVGKFGAERGEVVKELHTHGFPIRESDVIVAFSLRAFI